MARKEIAVKKYVVKQSAEKRGRLEAMVRAGKNSATHKPSARSIAVIRREPRKGQAVNSWSTRCSTAASLSLAGLRAW